VRRWILIGLLVAPGIALTVAWGWNALIIYSFFAFVAVAQVAMLAGWTRMIQHVGREWSEGRFRLTR
jgi:hypothetical protein